MKFKYKDKVRIKASIRHPVYGWGTIDHNDVGTFVEYVSTSPNLCIVSFGRYSGFRAVEHELEYAEEDKHSNVNTKDE